MLFDTLRRKNQAEQEEREWNANRPADYVSRNKDAMDSLTGQIGSGFDWDTGSKAYQQYRAQAQANAAASAENAQANAAMLAGGYGSSYADSVAKQGQQQPSGTNILQVKVSTLLSVSTSIPGINGDESFIVRKLTQFLIDEPIPFTEAGTVNESKELPKECCIFVTA